MKSIYIDILTILVIKLPADVSRLEEELLSGAECPEIHTGPTIEDRRSAFQVIEINNKTHTVF